MKQVTEAIADAKDTEPMDLDISIENHISMEAIQHLTDHKSKAWRLQFETPNHVVELMGDGTIIVDGETTKDGPSVDYR